MKHYNKPDRLPYPFNLVAAILESEEQARAIEWDDDHDAGLMFALSTLSEREQRVIWLRYGHLMTHEAIGCEFGLTRERMRQVDVKALRKLRHPDRLAAILGGYEAAEAKLKAWFKDILEPVEGGGHDEERG